MPLCVCVCVCLNIWLLLRSLGGDCENVEVDDEGYDDEAEEEDV